MKQIDPKEWRRQVRAIVRAFNLIQKKHDSIDRRFARLERMIAAERHRQKQHANKGDTT